MYHTLFTLFGVSLTSYRASKALAAVVAAIMLGREFRRLGWNPEVATTLVVTSTVVGFLGAKLYYLGEHAANLSMHDFGRSGFTCINSRSHRFPRSPSRRGPWPT